MPGLSPVTVPSGVSMGGCALSAPLASGVKGAGPVASTGSARTTAVPEDPNTTTAVTTSATARNRTPAAASPGESPSAPKELVGGARRRGLATVATDAPVEAGVMSPDPEPASAGGRGAGSGATYGASIGGGGGSTPPGTPMGSRSEPGPAVGVPCKCV